MATSTPTNTYSPEEHGTIRSYVLGFICSLALTLLPFYWVTFKSFEPQWLLIAVLGIAFLQLLVQMFFFLHLNSKKTRWNLMAFIFTLLMVLVVIIGSLWIMINMNANMM